MAFHRTYQNRFPARIKRTFIRKKWTKPRTMCTERHDQDHLNHSQSTHLHRCMNETLQTIAMFIIRPAAYQSIQAMQICRRQSKRIYTKRKHQTQQIPLMSHQPAGNIFHTIGTSNQANNSRHISRASQSQTQCTNTRNRRTQKLPILGLANANHCWRHSQLMAFNRPKLMAKHQSIWVNCWHHLMT